MTSRCTIGGAAAVWLVLGIVAAEAIPTTSPSAARDTVTDVAAAIAEAAQRFTIPPDWIRAVIAVESGGNTRAQSPKGAMGLMQLMPETWAPLRLKYHLGGDPYDIHDNILAGTALLRELYDRFGATGFLAAYNAGPRRYLSFLTTGRPLREETQLYLAKLAPSLGGELGYTLLTSATLHNWQSAPLFVSASPSTGDLAPNRSRSGNSAVNGVQPDMPPSRLAPHAGSLFATLASKVSP